jgi:hypothetical protein
MSDILDRVRVVNPDPGAPREDQALFDAIVSRPGDRRLLRSSKARRRTWPAAIVLAVALLGGGAAWAQISSDPLELFRSNPQNDGNQPGGLWDQKVVPSTVRRMGVVQIPTVGGVQFWYGETQQHGWCGALRSPDGGWLGTEQAGPTMSGGTVPGCFPTRQQLNGSHPVYLINGFDYVENDIDLRGSGGQYWRISYGLVDGSAAPVRVVDLISGTEVPVTDGTFVIAVPDADPSQLYELHLVAYDARGAVVADENRAQG